MKKAFLLFVFVMVSTITVAQDFDIVGKWKGTHPEGDDVILTFDSKGFVMISDGVEKYGGKAVDMGDGLIIDFMYEIKMKSEPFSLDIVMYNINDRSVPLRKRGYFKIINKNTIALKQEMFSDDNAWYEDLIEVTLQRQK